MTFQFLIYLSDEEQVRRELVKSGLNAFDLMPISDAHGSGFITAEQNMERDTAWTILDALRENGGFDAVFDSDISPYFMRERNEETQNPDDDRVA